MRETVILSFGAGSWYPQGVTRLQSLLGKYQGFDFHGWKGSYPPGSPPHKEVPYGFKAYGLKWAQQQGYKRALWLDSSVYPHKDPTPVLNLIRDRGYFLLLNGWNQAAWSTDAQLKYYGYTRDEAEKMPHPVGGLIGVNFQHETGKALFDMYFKAAQDKMFVGPWWNKNHEVSKDPRVLGSRHDQACLGFIAQKLDLKLMSGNFIDYSEKKDTFFYVHPVPPKPKKVKPNHQPKTPNKKGNK